MACLLYWLTGFRGEDFKTLFPIRSYVKTTVCPLKAVILDGGQGHWTQILKLTIHAMFALNWLTGFRGEDF